MAENNGLSMAHLPLATERTLGDKCKTGGDAEQVCSLPSLPIIMRSVILRRGRITFRQR